MQLFNYHASTIYMPIETCPSNATYMLQMPTNSYGHETNVITHTTYGLNAVSNVTRSTGIHTFPIIGICPLNNMLKIAYVCCTALLLQFTYRPPITLHVSNKTTTCNSYLPYYYNRYTNNKCTPQIPHI